MHRSTFPTAVTNFVSVTAFLLASSVVVDAETAIPAITELLPSVPPNSEPTAGGIPLSFPGAAPTIVAAKVRSLSFAEPNLRGSKEVEIFRNNAPGVVLISTDDGGLGSGSLVSVSGEIISNWHVVEGFSDVSIVFFPTKTMPTDEDYFVASASVVATDETKDLALLKLTSPPPPSAKLVSLGNLDGVQIGDDTHAIGHPTGLTWTYTKGYISSLRPSWEWQYSEDSPRHSADVIQTQTPISPGNSGGPLFNDQGQLIGVNTFKGEGEAINFAVSVEEVKQFISNIPNDAGPKPRNCEPVLLFNGRNDEDTGDVRTVDRNCDGEADLVAVFLDDTSEPYIVYVDDDGDGNTDGYVLDNDRDGGWDISYWDTTGDGEPDTQGIHANGDLSPRGFRPI